MNKTVVDTANKAKIAGTGDVTIASGENRTTHEWTTTNKDCNWWGKCTTTVTHGVEDKTTQVGSDVKGASVEISAGKDLTTVASTIEGGNVNLSAQGKIDYLAALNVDKRDVQSKSSSWFGIDMKWLTAQPTDKETKDSSIQTRAATTSLQSEGDILSESGGNTRLQGTQVKAQTFTVNAGVGPSADPNAKIIIEGVKETLQTSHTEKSESLVWQAQSGNGSTTETAVLANIQAKTKFSAPGGIDVQLLPGDPLRGQIQTLSQQPGMEWLNDLSQRKDVNWQEIKLAKDSWSYDQQGLTPAGAAILAIAIAAYTGGMGAELLGGTAATSTSAATLMGSTTLGAAANAGFAALASSAGVSFVNNGGDIGKTLKDMGSSQNVKSVLTAMATAGVLTELGSSTTATGQTGANAQAISTTQAADKFAANLMQNVTNNMASAVVSSAINGKPLNEDTLSTALSSALITAGTAQAANSIGAATQNGTLNAYTQALAHALAGCVGGAATTGNSGGCSAGAVGAVVGELSAGYAKTTGATDANALAFAKSMSAVAGALVGGPDSAAAVNVAAQMGANAAANNYLNHTDAARRAVLAQACSNTAQPCSQQEQNELNALNALDKKNETALNNACNPAAGGDLNTAACRAEYSNLQSAKNSYNNFAGMSGSDIVKEMDNLTKINNDSMMYNPNQGNSNAGLSTIAPASNGCVTAECSGNVLPAPSENRSVEQIDKDLKSGVCKAFAGNVTNAVLPASVVMRPIFDGAGKIVNWAVDKTLSNTTGAVICGG